MSKKRGTTEPLSVAEFAAKHAVSVGRVHQWIAEGRLPVVSRNPHKIAANTPRPAAKKRGPEVGFMERRKKSENSAKDG